MIAKHEIRRDLQTYVDCLIDGRVDACVIIEKKYGMFGETPEAVTTEMNRLYDEAPE